MERERAGQAVGTQEHMIERNDTTLSKLPRGRDFTLFDGVAFRAFWKAKTHKVKGLLHIKSARVTSRKFEVESDSTLKHLEENPAAFVA